MKIVYRKYFKESKDSYRQVVIEGDNAKHEVFNDRTGVISITWDMPIKYTNFLNKQSMIDYCINNGYIAQ